MGSQVEDKTHSTEIEHLRAEVRQLRRERNQAYEMLKSLEHLGKQTWWDGAPDKLPELAARIRRALHAKAISLALLQDGLLSRQAIDPPDVQFDLSESELQDALQDNEPRVLPGPRQGVLAVPLGSGAKKVGLLELVLDDASHGIHTATWRALGAQVTSILLGGRMLSQLGEARRREELIYNITRHLVPGLNLDKMLSDLLVLIIPSTGADDGSVMLLNDQGQVIRQILVRKDLAEEEQEQAVRTVLASGLAGWVIEHKEATIVRDTLQDERWVHLTGDASAVRSALALPLQRGGQIRGLLFLVHHAPEYFDQSHVVFLRAVADQAAIAVENAYLLEQTQKRIDELALINEISQAATSLHLDDVLRIVTQRIAEALHVRRCAIFMLDNSATQLILRAVHNSDLVSNHVNLVIDLGSRPHIERAILTRQSVPIENVLLDERMRPFWDQARELGIRAQLAVPLIAKQRVIGAISIDRDATGPPFAQDEIDLCQTIAQQAASAIENARLYEEVQRRAERLWLANMVSHEIGAVLDVNLLLWEVIRLIRETLDCYHVAIALIEQDELVFESGINYSYQPMLRIRLSLQGEGEGIPGRVARQGASILVPDVRQDERYTPLQELTETRSELAVPLKVPGRGPNRRESGWRTIGVLDLQSTQVGAFSPDDRDLLEALAAQVGVAIESARLFSRVREERATLEAIIDGTDDAIIVTDTADQVLFLNPAARDAFTAGENVQPGVPLSAAVHNEALLRLWHETQPEGHAAEVPLADGRTFYTNITPIARVGKVGVMQDISYLKEMDRVKSEFVSTVSHDLRSPLQVIQTSSELLPRLGALNQEQRKEVEHILAVVRRMSRLVQNLLDIGRIEAGIGMEVEACAIDEIIASAAGSLRSLAQKRGLDYVIEVPKTLPLVRGNPFRLDQVISNLINNAIKFTFEGSVTVRAWAENREVVIEVSDTGVGIPPEAMGKLFEKFYRVSRPETRGIPGTGLGLAIARSIVESYGGRIEVSSFARLGSTFRVTLPVYEPAK
jgi:signal transduction histidine kinase